MEQTRVVLAAPVTWPPKEIADISYLITVVAEMSKYLYIHQNFEIIVVNRPVTRTHELINTHITIS
jgi:hypothetical protein